MECLLARQTRAAEAADRHSERHRIKEAPEDSPGASVPVLQLLPLPADRGGHQHALTVFQPKPRSSVVSVCSPLRTNKLMAVKSTAPTANVTSLEAIFALLRLDNAVQTHCKYETRLQANKHRRRNAGSSSSPCAGRAIVPPPIGLIHLRHDIPDRTSKVRIYLESRKIHTGESDCPGWREAAGRGHWLENFEGLQLL
jgi:hypothetical protein